MSALWQILEHTIESGQEARKIDLKQSLDVSSRRGRANFAKDVAAMANTGGGRGYLVIGVVDAKHRTSSDSRDYIVGFRPDDAEAFGQQMVQALEVHCSPVPEVVYSEMVHPSTGRPLGVITVARGFERPYRANGEVYVRRGSHTASVDESQVSGGPRRVLVSFCRPMDSTQLEQLSGLLGEEIDEFINVAYSLANDKPYLAQVRAMIDQVGFTPDEWQSLPLVVNVHPLAPAAAAVLSWLHGLRGHFPDVVRLAQNEHTGNFEVVEVLRLQSVRNETRDWISQL